MSPPDLTLKLLEKVLSSDAFRSAGRSSRLLRFLVEHAVRGQADNLKEYTLGAEALGRGASFDPRIDSIARVEVSRLRSRLDQYYAKEGRSDLLTIVLPKGSYVPLFEARREAPRQKEKVRPLAWFAFGGAAAACLFAIAFWAVWRRPKAMDRPLVQLEVELRSGGQLGSVVGTHVAISPDGTRLVFVASGADGVPHLFTRLLNQPDVSELPGTEGARAPFFSPNGQWVAFWSGGKVRKAPIAGGTPIILADAADLLGASWGEDGAIVAILNSTFQLWRVPADGGRPEPVGGLKPGSDRLAWPQLLPGGRAVLFTSSGPRGPDAGSIEVFSFRDGARKTVVRGGTFGRYLPSGHLVYINQGTLYALPFDLSRLEAAGAAVPVLPEVEYSPVFGNAQFDFSQTGLVVYRRTTASGQFTVEWVDTDGKVEPMISTPGPYLWPRLSPDGGRLALARTDSGGARISIFEHRSGKIVPLNSGEGNQTAPVWSPDGQFLVLQSANQLQWVRTGQPGQASPILSHAGVVVPWSFTPDGKRLAYYAMSPETHFDLWTVPLEFHDNVLRAGKPEPFLQTRAPETYPTFSRDGRWLAFSSLQSGALEVFVRAFPDNGKEVQVSRGGGRVPRWSNGHELLYNTDDQRVMVAAYRVKHGSFEADPPRLWSKVSLGDTGVLPNFDIMSDGRRIAALMPAVRPKEQQAQNHVTFLMNFFDEVDRRLMNARK